MKKSFLRDEVLRIVTACVVVVVLAVSAPSAFAKDPAPKDTLDDDRMFAREPWPTQRVVLILPLQLGPGWNLNREQAAPILPEAEQKLQQAMQRTGKFSTTQLHRYHPIFLRAIQDKVLTREQVNTVLATPTVEAIQGALGKMRFDQPPLLAEFAMEEISTEAGSPIPTVRSQVTGKLYEANDPVAFKTIVVTSEPVPLYNARKKGNQTVYVRRNAAERIIAAADDAFIQIAREFVKPLDEIKLPEVAVPENVIIDPNAPGGTVVRPVITVPKGQVLGTFPAPKQ